MYVCVCIYIYIYMYIKLLQQERDGSRNSGGLPQSCLRMESGNGVRYHNITSQSR